MLPAATLFAQTTSSSLPVISVFQFNGAATYAPRITSAVNAGLSSSKRVRLVDRTTFDRTMKELQLSATASFRDNTVIVRAGQQTGAQYVLEGNLTSVNFDNQRIGQVNQHTCNIEAQLKLTDIETGVSDFATLKGNSMIADNSRSANETLLRSSLNDLEAEVRTFARKRFPAIMDFLEVTEQNDKKGIVSFRVEGEGLTAKQTGSGGGIADFFGTNTKISIICPREVTRTDGTKRWVREEVARAKITTVEDGGTAICSVTDNGKKLQELIAQKARLVIKTIN
ncbi:hypothetical protein GCM10027190_12400 [Spirosoma areae]